MAHWFGYTQKRVLMTAPSSPTVHSPSIIANVLTVAGTDPTGGAGIGADLKTFGALGVYGMSAFTALVAQNTQGVQDVHRPPVDFLAHQLRCVSEDVRIDGMKFGMLFDAEVIETVHEWLEANPVPIVVLDPVMVATSGHRLLVEAAEAALTKLAPLCSIVTPNIPELAVMVTHMGKAVNPATTIDEAIEQGKYLAEAAQTHVVVKGGHLASEAMYDALVTPSGEVTLLQGLRVDTPHTHGTGCSLSAALAALAAKDVAEGRELDWVSVLTRAKHWMTLSLLGAERLAVGKGQGPMQHFAYLWDAAGTEPRLTGEQLLNLWWNRIAELRAKIDDLDFVRALGDGTLATDRFVTYQVQDALYLGTYSRVLAQASALAPDRAAQAFWAKGANECIVVELSLHDSWIPEGAGDAPMDAVTTGYTNHLLSRAQLGNYGELIAAILPCYWLYQDIGDRLVERNHPDHTYNNWLTMYGDPAFAEATILARHHVARALDAATDAEREVMWQAFWESCVWEWRFFDR